ncbi:MAG: hypothetical protein QGH40_13455, partial [bacterium]|nr:hypothetical protein [bacterium]
MIQPIEPTDHVQAESFERGSPMSTTTGFKRPLNSIWKGVWRFLGPPARGASPPPNARGRRLPVAVGHARIFIIAYIIVLAGMVMAPAAAIAVQTTASWTDGGVNSADSQQVVISKPSGASEWKVNATSGTGTNTTGWRTSASWTDTGVYDNQQVGYQADYKQLTVDDD